MEWTKFVVRVDVWRYTCPTIRISEVPFLSRASWLMVILLCLALLWRDTHLFVGQGILPSGSSTCLETLSDGPALAPLPSSPTSPLLSPEVSEHTLSLPRTNEQSLKNNFPPNLGFSGKLEHLPHEACLIPVTLFQVCRGWRYFRLAPVLSTTCQWGPASAGDRAMECLRSEPLQVPVCLCYSLAVWRGDSQHLCALVGSSLHRVIANKRN